MIPQRNGGARDEAKTPLRHPVLHGFERAEGQGYGKECQRGKVCLPLISRTDRQRGDMASLTPAEPIHQP